LSANVDKDFVKTRKNAGMVKYINDTHREVTEETNGFLIFQEQIAMLAHKLGKDLSLDEGNMLRKVLTKKGTGKAAKVKKALHGKFVQGCLDKNMSKAAAERLWDTFEYFSGYGFNKSHAVSYSMISFQCAWLLTYYPECWMAAFLDKEPETRKEKAIAIAKQFGFEIEPLNINTSGRVWEISEDGKRLIQPLSFSRDFGDSAIDQIFIGRPFESIEDFLFNEEMRYSKLNKKSLDVLVRSGTLTPLMDNRFTGMKHFWSSVAVDRPRKVKNLEENIELYAPEGDFTEEEKIQSLVDLTGQFPINKVVMRKIMETRKHGIPPISEYDPDLQVVWLVPRKITQRRQRMAKTI
jgi:DNA polymerase-3 subunit alpha